MAPDAPQVRLFALSPFEEEPLYQRMNLIRIFRGAGLCSALLCLLLTPDTSAAEITFHTRARVETAPGSGEFNVVVKPVTWDANKTAVIICDMWDAHWCKGATERVAEIAPVMNEVVFAARGQGMLIIHAPSETMPFYKETPQRQRALEAPRAEPPSKIERWRRLDPAKEGPFPIDDSDGGCDDHPQCKGGPPYPWKRQISTIQIAPEDAVTDSGEEVFNLMEQRGIENLIVMGVHANMCVLGRSFAIRQMVALGKNVLLMRDMTDTMYNSRRRPFVSHFQGTDLVIEHIEKYWCPSITSTAFTGRAPFRFKDDARRTIAVLISEDEYNAKETLPAFVKKEFGDLGGFDFRFIQSDQKNSLPGVEQILDADLAVFYLRRRTLPPEQLSLIRRYVDSGRPVVALRTSSHGFQNWLEFDRDVLGGNYSGHHGNKKGTMVRVIPERAEHPIVQGLPAEEFRVASWLYKVSPLAPTATPLMMGRMDGQPPEPVAWINTHRGGRVFYTSLGHQAEFETEPFRRLLRNGMLWALGELKEADSAAATPFVKDARDLAATPEVREHIEKFTARGQTIEPGSKPLTPAESLKRFTVADGLEISLVASEPAVRQPLNINFDERGRMWVVQYLQYPFPAGLKIVAYDEHLRAQFDKVPPAPPNHIPGADRITIFEDRNGDGYFETHKDFVTGLNIATSALPGRGGVWVLNPPYLLFYPDKNGDDLPDGPPEVHLEGFGLEDTHAVANSLLWGPDGWIYGAQGSTCTATIRGIRFLGQAIWRYHPETREFELFAEGGGNTFHIEFDRKGRIYSGTNWGNQRGLYFVQGGYYVKNFGKHGPLTNPYAFGYFPHMPHKGDQARFSHAFVVEEGGAFPEQFFEKIFAIVPLHNRIEASSLIPDGSTYRTLDVERPLVTDDKWFRPVDIKTGPDGGIYLADWYDIRLTHVDPRDNWDRSNGRIYRISAQGAPRAGAFDLSKKSSAELIEVLSHPNKWFRQQALRLFGDRRDASVIPALSRLVDSGDGQLALEALWALNLSGGFDEAFARKYLNHPDEHVRRWIIRLLGDSRRVSSETRERLIELARTEPAVQVRSQLASSAKRLPGKDGLAIAFELLRRSEDLNDPHLPLLLWWAVEDKAISDRDQVLALFNCPEAWREPMIANHIMHRLAQRYAAEETDAALETAAALMNGAPGMPERERLLASVAEAFKGRAIGNVPPALRNAIAGAGKKDNPALVLLKLRLGAAGEEELAFALQFIRNDDNQIKAQRIDFIQALGSSGRTEAIEPLLEAARSSRWHSVRRAALQALQHYNHPEIGREIVSAYARLPSDQGVRPQAIDVLSKRPEWSRALLQAIAANEIPRADVPFEIIERLKLHREPEITMAAQKLWGATRQTPDALRQRIDQVAKILLSGSGSAARGKELFAANCASCHKLHGEGQTTGPDLTGYERDNLDFLLLAVIDPNAGIREEYTNYELETADGLLLTGYLLDQTPQSVTIEDGEGGSVVIARARIKSLQASAASRMPEGLLDALSSEEIRDLFAYLRSPGALAVAPGGR
jgi:putative heme-binding domain-containing protein